MPRGVPISPEQEASIISRLLAERHASRVARAEGVSYATVWRLADRECVELTGGRMAKGYKRLPAERRAAIEAALRDNPKATHEKIARQLGVSRPTVTRIEGGRRRARHREVNAG
jgi:DNA-binding transcriptional ArsR family regulator